MKFQDLNARRVCSLRKSSVDEDFLRGMNELLREMEVPEYVDYEDKFPTLIGLGVPRSGSTLTTQLLAHSFDVGYINRLMARFWLAPVTGIRLSRSVLGDVKGIDFHSSYGRTQDIADLHSFGYFWRHWLRMEGLSDSPKEVDWVGLRRTLLNVQATFGKGLCCSGQFCTRHVAKLVKLLPKVLFVYVERDPLDTMISLLDARQRYYGSAAGWFGVSPREYPRLKGLSGVEQIVGQVYYLRKEFQEHESTVSGHNITRVTLEELCTSPAAVLEKVSCACKMFCDCDLTIVQEPPESFEFHQYHDRERDKGRFQRAMSQYPEDVW